MFSMAAFWSFVFWGLLGNFIFGFITFVCSTIRISSFNIEEINYIKNFMIKRAIFIDKCVPKWKVYLSTCTIFLPMYLVCIYSYYLFYMYKHPGAVGLINALIKCDKIRICNIIPYNSIKETQNNK